jgi:predicted enzyme related to lactoylglutathione lyase
MNQGIQTIIYPVKDKDTARELFTKLLGVEGLTGPVGYHHVTDIKKSVQILLEAGGHVQQAVKDVGGGKLIAIVKDSDGNMIGFIQMS